LRRLHEHDDRRELNPDRADKIARVLARLGPGLIGRLAAGALAIPLIWAVLFVVAALSWMGRGTREIVHLKDMYESDRFVKLVWRAQLTLGILALVLTLAGISFLAHHPNFLLNL
jgi:hypothetical protein